MSKVKKIAEWTVIALFGVIVVAVLSIFTYRAVVSSDWYIEGQTDLKIECPSLIDLIYN